MSAKTFWCGLFAAALVSAASVDTRLAEAAHSGDRPQVKALLMQKVDVNAAEGDGATALHWAAFRDDLEMAKELLAAGADVKARTREGGITPLFMACSNGSAAMIEALLNAGADPNSVKANGTTALMAAASGGSSDAVQAMLNHGARVNATEAAHGQTALMFAAGFNRARAIKVLLAHGADPNIASLVKKVETVRFDQDGGIVEDKAGAKAGSDEVSMARAAAETARAANEAAQNALDTFARSLRYKGAEYRVEKARTKAGDVAFRPPQRVGPKFSGGMTALLYAAREGYIDAARALLEGRADLNQVSADKYSPLVMAIMNGHLDLGQYFLDHGADVNLPAITGLTALYATLDVRWAPRAWVPQPRTDDENVTYLELMKHLLEHGANANARISEKSWFRSYGGGVAWVDEAGATPFWRAAQAADLGAMRLLMTHGADPKAASAFGDTPLMVAAGLGWGANWSVDAPYNRLDAVKYCIDLGNEVNATDAKGYTALHGAAYLGNNELVNYFVKLGAKVDAKSKAGDTVADMANGPTRFGIPHPYTVEHLVKLGSGNSHNCRSDQCVVAANASVYDRPLTPNQLVEKDSLDKFAVAVGFTEARYLPEILSGRYSPGSQQ
jgi:ankyrin repeat protein